MKEAQEKSQRYKERIETLKKTKLKLKIHMNNLTHSIGGLLDHTVTPSDFLLNGVNPDLNGMPPPTILQHRKSLSDLNEQRAPSIFPPTKHLSSRDEKVFKNLKKRAEFALFKNIESQIITSNHNTSQHIHHASIPQISINQQSAGSQQNSIGGPTRSQMNLSNLSLLEAIPSNVGYFSTLRRPSMSSGGVTPKPEPVENRINHLGQQMNHSLNKRLNILSTPKLVNNRILHRGSFFEKQEPKFIRVRQDNINQEVLEKLTEIITKPERRAEEKESIKESVSFLKKLFPTHDYLFKKNKNEEGHNNTNRQSPHTQLGASLATKHFSEQVPIKAKPKSGYIQSQTISDAFRQIKNKRFNEMLGE